MENWKFQARHEIDLHVPWNIPNRSFQMATQHPLIGGSDSSPKPCSARLGLLVLTGLVIISLRFAGGLKPSTHTEFLSSTESRLGVNLPGIPDRPIVGILSLPLTDSFREIHHITTNARAVIPASYAKWLQSAGAQVVVIPHFWEISRIENIVGKLSGVLFTGGDNGDVEWNRTTSWIYNEALRRNNTDSKLALWGTCLGFERIMQVASEDELNTVVKAVLVDGSIPVEWTGSPSSSPFLSYLGREDTARFANNDIAYNFHVWGVTKESWAAHADKLDPLFDVIGMHHTDDSTFVAMVEGKQGLPIWGVQFHPEKALFEWSPQLHYPHSETAILANRKVADFFVHQVRRIQKHSPIGFSDFEDESRYAIYNYPSVFTGVDVNATRAVYTETYIIN